MSKFEQFLSVKKSGKAGGLDLVLRRHSDSRAAIYQAFADDERDLEARTEQSPLVQWARGNVGEVRPRSQSGPTKNHIPAD